MGFSLGSDLLPAAGTDTLHACRIGPRVHRITMVFVVVLAVAALYSWALATTRPFTTGADAVVALGFLPMGLVLVGCVRRRGKRAQVGRPGRHRGGKLTTWVLAITVLGVVELTAYFAGWGAGRQAFPTLSSLYDEASSSSVAAKAVLVFLWLAMGWGLFRPRPKPAESQQP